MAKTKRKRIDKPKAEKQEVDGLNLSFEEAMKSLAKPDKVKAHKGSK
jgi:hypothetical protein